MCCRYYMEMCPELRPIIEAANRSALKDRMVSKLGKPLVTEGEVFPTNMVPVIASSSQKKKSVFPMVWGYTLPGLDRPVVNTRSESAAGKDVWKEGWSSHRCIIPASWYFEWSHYLTPSGQKKTGTKYAIQPRGDSITYLAGIYRIEEYRDLKYPVFSVLTREPSGDLRKIHDRMPVIMPGDMIDSWINPDNKAEDLITQALTDMIFEEAG